MSISSIGFLAFAAAAVVFFNLGGSAEYRKIILGTFNAAFIAGFAGSMEGLLPLLAFLALGYIFILIIQSGRGSGLLPVFIAVIVATFIYLKKYTVIDFTPGLSFPYVMVGLSYILFRIIHLMVDLQGGAIKVRSRPPFISITPVSFSISPPAPSSVSRASPPRRVARRASLCPKKRSSTPFPASSTVM